MTNNDTLTLDLNIHPFRVVSAAGGYFYTSSWKLDEDVYYDHPMWERVEQYKDGTWKELPNEHPDIAKA